MSTLSDIADAVVNELNQGAFSQEFTAVRAYRPVFELSELKTLHVTVVPKATTRAMIGRRHTEHETQIDIAVQQRVDPGDVDECDPMDALCEEIADWFGGRILDGVLAICKQVERNPIYDPEHLDQKRVFTGVITLTFAHSS